MSIQGIILAAGFSSRFGKHKMQIDLLGKTLIGRTVESMSEICDKIFVVCGYKIEEMTEILKSINKVQIINNTRFEEGMFSSVRVGIQQVTTEKFFLTPGDIPLVSKRTFEVLLKSSARIAIPTFQGRKGHPVLIHSSLIKDILAEPEDSNLKMFLNKKGYERFEVDDENILKDVDTIEDYQNLIDKLNLN